MLQPSENTNQTQEQLEALSIALDSGSFVHVRQMLNQLPAATIAHLLESSPHKARKTLWRLVPKENEGDVLNFLNEDLQSDILNKLSPEEVVSLTEGLETDDLADILQQLPDQEINEVLLAMGDQDRQRLEAVLSYPEDTAGGLLNTDTITVRRSHTLDVVLRYLRRHDEIPTMTDNLLVVNRDDHLVGLLPLRKVLVSDPNLTVSEIMITDFKAIPVSMPDNEVAQLFERMDWISAPVVNEEGKLLGRITIDDIVDVIREDADHSFMSMAGLDEEDDIFAPVLKTAKRRAIWLGVNLITAFIAASVINRFASTIDEIVALAVLMTIVASMGGVAGNQTITLVIRGMAQGQIGKTNASWLMWRELGVGLLNGLLWAAVAALIASFWFDDNKLAYIFGGAMVVNLIVAALSGAFLPMFLKKLKIDPALAGSVVLTTITDVVGFLSFLGFAALLY
ncbi:magnesium transporter [Haliea sp. AH-315-K21]|uniref:Magnesium transporter MgtE n=1 Tax=SAR86 cluster bacterium TaxID=2030880 RepID=A0A2A5CAL0_9GAMM|nr:magnesium transporter [Haliea sp. AH-315-K21]MBN4075557.1 magnesium transporter [Gammaproteobacteria bacterium AH-315-E17]PCJ40615.1 MAG: magnesium transporter [SAR86 cluster bacterium]